MATKEFSFIKQNLYIKYLTHNCFFGVTPVIVGMERCAKDKKEVSVLKDHYALHYVYEGEGIVTIDGKEHTVGENSLFLLSPDVHIRYKPASEHPWRYAWIEFFGTDVGSILEHIVFCDGSIFVCEEPDVFKELFVEILNLSRQENVASYLGLTAALLKVLQGMVNESKKGRDEQENSGYKRLQPVIDYINRHYYESECTPRSIAEKFGYTLSYFSRVFRREFNQPVSTYIIHLRVNQACMLLMHTDFSVSEIAYMVGYSLPFYFSSQFRKMKDCSPSEFRKHVKE